ncbi:MAG: thioredoxin [Flavobacteriaceae bacterium]|nr:thioredoxin [Flavobacteriaceae bacterium]
MKKLFLLSVLILVVSCKSNTKEQSTDTEISEEISAEEFNQLVPDEEDGGEMYLGKITREGLNQEPYSDWFNENYAGHNLDTTLIDSIKAQPRNWNVKVFMGSWCEDSQREVPALFKILDEIGYAEGNVELIAMDHDKKTPFGFEEGLNIEYVPTIIIMNDDGEMNRIVEYPIGMLEQDILMILKGENYTHAYSE